MHTFTPDDKHCEITTVQLTFADNQDAASCSFLAACREIRPDIPRRQEAASPCM